MIQLAAIAAYLIMILSIATAYPVFRSAKHPSLKVILAFIYGALSVLLLDDYRGGMIADSYNLNGSEVLIFSRAQTIIEAALFMLVLVMQVGIMMSSKKNRPKLEGDR